MPIKETHRYHTSAGAEFLTKHDAIKHEYDSDYPERLSFELRTAHTNLFKEGKHILHINEVGDETFRQFASLMVHMPDKHWHRLCKEIQQVRSDMSQYPILKEVYDSEHSRDQEK